MSQSGRRRVKRFALVIAVCAGAYLAGDGVCHAFWGAHFEYRGDDTRCPLGYLLSGE